MVFIRNNSCFWYTPPFSRSTFRIVTNSPDAAGQGGRTGGRGQDRGTVLLSCFHMRLDADELRIFLEGPCQGDQPEDDGLKRLLDAETIARLREVSGCGKIQADWWIA